MHDITKDLQDLEELYLALESRLEKQYQDLLAHRFPSSDEDREAAALERHILEAEKHLARLSSTSGIDALASRTERSANAACVASLKKRAQHLLELLGRNAAQCVQLQSAAQAGLQELRRGGQFLQSVRGYRENQPKFLDSCQ
jgi:hypothetical protein